MSKLLIILGMLALLFGGSFADECIGRPSNLKSGSGCGGGLTCGWGRFCNQENGVCESLKREGDDCEDAACEIGTSCRNSGDYYRCVASVHPGQGCDNFGSAPLCGTGSCVQNRCRGGNVGDACIEKDDCLGELTCPAGVCTGIPLGQPCESESCVVGAYCRNEVCTALPTSGNCTSGSQCAYRHACILPTDTSDVPECIAFESLAAGAFCNGVDSVCQSLTCTDNHCAESSPDYCNSGVSCSAEEFCGCGTSELTAGFGKCRKSGCAKLNLRYQDCFNENCKVATYFNGSCIQRNCEKEYLASARCNSGSFLFVSSFLSLFSLAALIATFSGLI